MKHEITTTYNGITGHLPKYCRACNQKIIEEKCSIIYGTGIEKIKCNNKMPCREHNFIAYMAEEKLFPPELAGGSGDE